ncbi:MAG: pyruvate dehydrogenase complex dihydrolipoamide acetyltransferase [Balneolaceae bacterium]|nr:pyruvate dehydrogenase complex dihydrolipoamide acetyltransferase [Balneolaceae bacterium]MCH8548906.1 pyruvate dehydrogenase complex dihydrolipoamide acetyltransferase [Balneolaceae bacterium]
MAIKIEMPKLSDTMEEGVIAKWNIKEGDKVDAGDVIAEVETDKATMEVEAFDPGTVLKIIVNEGDAVPLGGIMAIIGDEGEDISDLLDGADSGDSAKSDDSGEEKKESKKSGKDESKKDFDPILGDVGKEKSKKETSSSDSKKADDGDGRIKASPLARSMAEDKGIDLANVEGSGPDGRIIKKDIESYKPSEKPKSAAVASFESQESEDVKVSQMRKVIARRLSESKFTNPHFYETIDIDMEAAIEARKKLNEVSDVKISFNDIVVKACAAALRRHPDINSSWLDDVIRKHGDVNVAVAVAVDEGLMTPVIQHADRKNLRQISTETRELAGLARDRKLQPEQMEGSTFTISNLGMFGIEEFTAIINPPNACILAVGAIRDVPVVKDGAVVPGKRMKVTLSSDHRVVDGAKAAQFLNTLRQMVESPLSMLL